MHIDSQLLTVAEAADRLKQSRSSIRRKIRHGELEAVRLGDGDRGPLRISVDELDAHIRPARATTDAADGARSN